MYLVIYFFDLGVCGGGLGGLDVGGREGCVGCVIGGTSKLSGGVSRPLECLVRCYSADF